MNYGRQNSVNDAAITKSTAAMTWYLSAVKVIYSTYITATTWWVVPSQKYGPLNYCIHNKSHIDGIHCYKCTHYERTWLLHHLLLLLQLDAGGMGFSRTGLHLKDSWRTKIVALVTVLTPWRLVNCNECALCNEFLISVEYYPTVCCV